MSNNEHRRGFSRTGSDLGAAMANTGTSNKPSTFETFETEAGTIHLRSGGSHHVHYGPSPGGEAVLAADQKNYDATLKREIAHTEERLQACFNEDGTIKPGREQEVKKLVASRAQQQRSSEFQKHMTDRRMAEADAREAQKHAKAQTEAEAVDRRNEQHYAKHGTAALRINPNR